MSEELEVRRITPERTATTPPVGDLQRGFQRFLQGERANRVSINQRLRLVPVPVSPDNVLLMGRRMRRVTRSGRF